MQQHIARAKGGAQRNRDAHRFLKNYSGFKGMAHSAGEGRSTNRSIFASIAFTRRRAFPVSSGSFPFSLPDHLAEAHPLPALETRQPHALDRKEIGGRRVHL